MFWSHSNLTLCGNPITGPKCAFAFWHVLKNINFESSEVMMNRVISRNHHVRDLEITLIWCLRQPHWLNAIK